MNPVSVTYSGTGAQTPIQLDYRVPIMNASWVVIVPGGVTTSLTVDHTYDNVNDPSVTPVWLSSAAITATTEGTFTTPYQFMRVNIASLSGGNVTLKYVQATGMVN